MDSSETCPGSGAASGRNEMAAFMSVITACATAEGLVASDG
jgi:hypothetical protein